MGKGGGGAPPNQQVTTTTSNLPEYARPYFENIMQRGQAESYRQYQPYEAERLAGFAPGQIAAQQETLGMRTPGQFGVGTGLAGAGGLQALQAGQYQPGQFAAPLTQAQQLQQFQMFGPQGVSGMQQISPQMQAAQTGFRPDLQMFQAQGPGMIGGGMESFTGQGTAEQFMSPYQQAVTDVQKKSAVREAQIAQQQANLGSVRQGTYGGARQALGQAERERGLLDRLSGIQATGSQAAFDQAQRSFEQEQARRLQGGLQTQQLGTQTGLENLRSQLGVQQLGTQTGVQTALANLDKSQQANVQNQAAQLQTQGLNAEQALRAALANQQAGLTVGQQNLQARLGVQQLGAQQGLESQRANQQALMEAQKMREQSRQFGGDLGLRGAGQAVQAGQTLGQLGQAQQQSDLQRLTAQETVGGQQRGFKQQKLDQQYADFLRQRDYPLEQLGYFSNLLRGVPVGLSSTQTTSAPPPSIASQIGGLGLAGLGFAGAARTAGFAEGGEVDGPFMLQEPKDIAMEYGGNKQKIEQAAKMGLIDPTSAVMAGMFIDRMRNAQQEEMAPEQTVAQDTFAPPQMAGLGATPQAAQMAQMAQMAPQQMPTEAGVAALPLSEDTFTAAGGGMIAFDDGGPVARFSKAGSVGIAGLARQGSSGGYPLGIKALMSANPGMTLAQATRLLLGPLSAVAGGGFAATQALMATDTGVGSDAAMGSGYPYDTEEMAGGRPDIPASAGTREDTPGLIDYLRAAGLAPREQVMDPTTGKFVDVPAKELFRSASPGLAGVLDKGTAPVVDPNLASAAPSSSPAASSASKKDPSEVALVTQAGQKLLPKQGMSVADFKAQQKEFGITDNVDADLKKQIEDLAAGSKGDREQAKYMAMLQAGLGIMGGTSPYALQNISAGALKGVERYTGDIKDIKKEERDVVKLRGELARAEDARKRGDFKTFQDASDKARDFEFKTAEQATRDRIAGIQENYYAGKLSADSARIAMLQERNRLAGVTNSRNARKQFMDEGGESKLRSEFIKRFGKNWEKDSKLMRSFKQQMDAEINKIAGMSDSGFTSAEDLLGD